MYVKQNNEMFHTKRIYVKQNNKMFHTEKNVCETKQ